MKGFDLEATTVVRAEDRERLENLARYLLRPPLADRRLRLLPADQVALEPKSPWKDGTRWISMSADTFLERLASLVPRPRTNQVLYRGVLAAHSARRRHVVPQPDDDERHRPTPATSITGSSPLRPPEPPPEGTSVVTWPAGPVRSPVSMPSRF